MIKNHVITYRIWIIEAYALSGFARAYVCETSQFLQAPRRRLNLVASLHRRKTMSHPYHNLKITC